MAKLTSKIAVPIILAGIFAIAVFIAFNYVEVLDYGRFDLGFYIVILILSVYVFFFGFATGQSLVSPLRELLDKATQLSKGNLSSRVYLETKDEFAELAKIFNEIAEELQASRARGEDAEKSVSIKVKARTQDLEEIINALEQKVKNRTIELERLSRQSEALGAELKNKGFEIAELKKKIKK
jgi:nitrate/nitrite-specific signal transduction histidine kinase